MAFGTHSTGVSSIRLQTPQFTLNDKLEVIRQYLSLINAAAIDNKELQRLYRLIQSMPAIDSFANRAVGRGEEVNNAREDLLIIDEHRKKIAALNKQLALQSSPKQINDPLTCLRTMVSPKNGIPTLFDLLAQPAIEAVIEQFHLNSRIRLRRICKRFKEVIDNTEITDELIRIKDNIVIQRYNRHLTIGRLIRIMTSARNSSSLFFKMGLSDSTYISSLSEKLLEDPKEKNKTINCMRKNIN